MNLFAIAASNAASLERTLDKIRAVLASDETDRLERFLNWIHNDGRVAINMRQTTLLILITTNNYQNIYEWAVSQSHISGRPVDDILQQRLGSFYLKRINFDNSFDSGQEFRYGALITAGAGATNYGNYCIILKESTVSAFELAFLKADSLKTYMLTEVDVDVDSIKEDAAPYSHKHVLAGIKHYHSLAATPEASWASLLCSGADYIEALFTGTLTVDDLQEVRMLKSDYERYYHLAFEDFRGKLDEAYRNLVDGFASIVKLLNHHGINVEVV